MRVQLTGHKLCARTLAKYGAFCDGYSAVSEAPKSVPLFVRPWILVLTASACLPPSGRASTAPSTRPSCSDYDYGSPPVNVHPNWKLVGRTDSNQCVYEIKASPAEIEWIASHGNQRTDTLTMTLSDYAHLSRDMRRETSGCTDKENYYASVNAKDRLADIPPTWIYTGWSTKRLCMYKIPLTKEERDTLRTLKWPEENASTWKGYQELLVKQKELEHKKKYAECLKIAKVQMEHERVVCEDRVRLAAKAEYEIQRDIYNQKIKLISAAQKNPALFYSFEICGELQSLAELQKDMSRAKRGFGGVVDLNLVYSTGESIEGVKDTISSLRKELLSKHSKGAIGCGSMKKQTSIFEGPNFGRDSWLSLREWWHDASKPLPENPCDETCQARQVDMAIGDQCDRYINKTDKPATRHQGEDDASFEHRIATKEQIDVAEQCMAKHSPAYSE